MEIPDPPTGVGSRAKSEWEQFWTSSVARAVQQSDYYALGRWCEAVDERERVVKQVREEPIVQGSQGQPRPNPLNARLKDLEKQIADFEDRFGMTPKSRVALGIAVGTAEHINRQVNQRDDDSTGGEEEVIDGFVEG